MANVPGDRIDSLRSLLQECCDQLSALSDEQVESALEGPRPPATTGGPTLVRAPAAASDGPRWRKLDVGPPPGVKQLASIAKPPLQIIAGLLQVLQAVLGLVRAFLIGSLDPFQALIQAAYEALGALIDDLLGSGAYLYYDAPGLTSADVDLNDAGLWWDPGETFVAGQAGERSPKTPRDGYERWADRFVASLDDPGDEHRPRFSDGAPVEAVFIAGGAPTLEALAQMVYVLGQLFNIDAFIQAWERFVQGAEDPRGRRVQRQSVAPDWESKTLVDLFPALRPLAELPDMLLGLLQQLEGLADLLDAVADAIEQKITLLLSLIEIIQKVIDLLDALSSAGLYVLPVRGERGVANLVETFRAARDRPEGPYVAGVCLLAGGPGLSDAAVLWSMLDIRTWAEAGAAASDELVADWERESAAITAAANEVELQQPLEDLAQALVDAPGSLAADSLSFGADAGTATADVATEVLHSPVEAYQKLQEGRLGDSPAAQAIRARLAGAQQHEWQALLLRLSQEDDAR